MPCMSPPPKSLQQRIEQWKVLYWELRDLACLIHLSAPGNPKSSNHMVDAQYLLMNKGIHDGWINSTTATIFTGIFYA